MLVEDSNGQSEIVSVCILACEDTDSIQWMMDIFKEHNQKWSETRVITADKDIKGGSGHFVRLRFLGP